MRAGKYHFFSKKFWKIYFPAQESRFLAKSATCLGGKDVVVFFVATDENGFEKNRKKPGPQKGPFMGLRLGFSGRLAQKVALPAKTETGNAKPKIKNRACHGVFWRTQKHHILARIWGPGPGPRAGAGPR